MNFNLDQTIENIHFIPETVLSKSDMDILEDKLSAFELILKKKDKAKLFDKLGRVIKFVADKGVEVGIAVLPYLGEIAKYIPVLKI